MAQPDKNIIDRIIIELLYNLCKTIEEETENNIMD
jgi:hypothetical protein